MMAFNLFFYKVFHKKYIKSGLIAKNSMSGKFESNPGPCMYYTISLSIELHL